MIRAAPIGPVVDGRQSPTALAVARGTRRLLRSLGYSTVTELALPNGRRADIVALGGNASIDIVEIKSSVPDFRSDLKWPDYRSCCDRLFFAIPPDMPADIMPEDAGLIVADSYGASVLRLPPEHRLATASRRSMLLRFAQAAADRLHLLADPDALL
jgi:hypothetical protein